MGNDNITGANGAARCEKGHFASPVYGCERCDVKAECERIRVYLVGYRQALMGSGALGAAMARG